MELRHRGHKPSEATSEDSHPHASCHFSSPGYDSNVVRRSASTGGVGNNGLVGRVVDYPSSPSPRPPPPRLFHRSTTSLAGPCTPTGGVNSEDSISPLPLSCVPVTRRSDHDRGFPAGAIVEDSSSSAPPPSPRRANSEGPPPWTSSGGGSHNNGRKSLLLVLHLIALSALSCAALYLRGAMTTVEAELEAAWEGHERLMRDEAIAREKGELEAEIVALELLIKRHESSHPELLLQQQRHGQTLESLNAQQLELNKVITHTTNLVSDASGEREKYKAMVDGVKQLGEYMKVRETALWKRIERLEGRIRRESHREALEWFGPGPHKVELEVEYPHSPESPSDPDPATWRKWTSYLLMEMAPLDLMPHTVNLFLKQVHRQLWDGTYVTVNARHLMQIGPRYEEYPANVTDLQRSYHNFHAEGLDKVSYQEYSAKYPHEQYTIGMAGRPSGPEFYINKMNNSDMHGPGGQMNDGGMHNEADPCFGRLVKGSGSFVEILALIDRVPLNSDQYPEAKVRIKSAAILLFEEGRGLVKLEPGKKWDEKDKIMPLPEIPHGV